MRVAEIKRKTTETDIALAVNLDGSGRFEGTSGIGFLDHMLQLFARHSLIDLQLTCRGDRQVDDHHSVEDIGICLGQALAAALGDKCGITRYGSQYLPMDEVLVLCALDISGRACLVYDLPLQDKLIGQFAGELGEEFFRAVSAHAGLNLHFVTLRTGNGHHMLEAAFKAFARAMRQAITIDPRDNRVPSTKGSL